MPASALAVLIALPVKTVPAANIAMPEAPVGFVQNRLNQKLLQSKHLPLPPDNVKPIQKKEAGVPAPAVLEATAGSMVDKERFKWLFLLQCCTLAI